jgi:probable 2-oxoglutarate dehydrogenase E1 component DHKTD1
MPALHVSAERPEDVCKVAKLATEYRQKFKSDIIVDIIGYRRHGHNELDEPSFTQPNMYKNITSRKSVVSIYAEQLQNEGILNAELAEEIKKKADAILASELTQASVDTKVEHHLQGNWKGLIQTKDIRTIKTSTGLEESTVKDIALKSVTLPSSLVKFFYFTTENSQKIHPRLKKAVVSSRETAIQKNEIDWPTAEAVAIGSLLSEGHHVRICGQDVGRGTFSQRHFELVDQDTEKRYVPLNHLSDKQGKLEVVNSPLSELAVLSFEYGYSCENPRDLVIWEAQFGDFANSAQVAIDQFISNGESNDDVILTNILSQPNG